MATLAMRSWPYDVVVRAWSDRTWVHARAEPATATPASASPATPEKRTTTAAAGVVVGSPVGAASAGPLRRRAITMSAHPTTPPNQVAAAVTCTASDPTASRAGEVVAVWPAM